MVISMFGGKITQCSQLCGHRFLSQMLSLPKIFPKLAKIFHAVYILNR